MGSSRSSRALSRGTPVDSENLTNNRRYRSLLFKFWTLCVFEPPFGGLGTPCDVHLGIIGKRAVDFLLVIEDRPIMSAEYPLSLLAKTDPPYSAVSAIAELLVLDFSAHA